MSKRRVFKRKIKDIPWSFMMQTQSAYKRDHGSDSDAITYPHDRDCYFNKSRFLPAAVRHELIHIYVASAGINSANLTADQMEETIAELYEQHGKEMQVIEDEILDFFMRHE